MMEFVLVVPDEDRYGHVGATGICFTALAFILSLRDGIRSRDWILLLASVIFGMASVAWFVVGWVLRNAPL